MKEQTKKTEKKKLQYASGLKPVDSSGRIFLNSEGELFVLEKDVRSGELQLVKKPIMFYKEYE